MCRAVREVLCSLACGVRVYCPYLSGLIGVGAGARTGVGEYLQEDKTFKKQ